MTNETLPPTLAPILIPLDGSELAESVVAHVLPLAVRDHATVHLLRVTGGPDALREGIARAVEESQARLDLQRVQERLTRAGVSAQAHVAHGDPVTEIVRASERLGIGLVAMCSHGRSGVLRWIRGSVAELALREATTPILLVSGHTHGQSASHGFRRVLVPLAGSERSAAILPYVMGLVRGTDAEIVLLRVEWAAVQRPVLATHFTVERIAASLDPWKKQLEQAGIRVRVIAKEGDPTQGILDVAHYEQVDLVALATHGRNGLMRFIDGSVTEKVLRYCPLPLLTVRAPDID